LLDGAFTLFVHPANVPILLHQLMKGTTFKKVPALSIYESSPGPSISPFDPFPWSPNRDPDSKNDTPHARSLPPAPSSSRCATKPIFATRALASACVKLALLPPPPVPSLNHALI